MSSDPERVNGGALTHVLQHAVPLQLRVPNLALQHHQLLLVLLLERVQPPLAVLQLVNQLLLDGDLAGDVGQVSLEVLCVKRRKFIFEIVSTRGQYLF